MKLDEFKRKHGAKCYLGDEFTEFCADLDALLTTLASQARAAAVEEAAASIAPVTTRSVEARQRIRAIAPTPPGFVCVEEQRIRDLRLALIGELAHWQHERDDAISQGDLDAQEDARRHIARIEAALGPWGSDLLGAHLTAATGVCDSAGREVSDAG